MQLAANPQTASAIAGPGQRTAPDQLSMPRQNRSTFESASRFLKSRICCIMKLIAEQ